MTENKNILDTIHLLSRSLRRRGTKGEGHHRGGFRIIRLLQKEGPMHASELAQKLEIRGSSLSEALDRLQEREMIERNTDSNDKRKVIVSLTSKALEKFESRTNKKDEQLEKILSVLSAEEQQEYIRLSQKIIDALN